MNLINGVISFGFLKLGLFGSLGCMVSRYWKGEYTMDSGVI